MSQFRALSVGGLPPIVLVAGWALACSGGRFAGDEPQSLGGGGSRNTDSVHARGRGGPIESTATGGVAGNAPQPKGHGELEGGVGGAEPTQPPRETGGGDGGSATTGGSGDGGGGDGGFATAGGSGGYGDGGAAGDPNVPDPPIGPPCASPISEPWTEPLSTDGTWHVGFGDPSVDTAGRQLVLSYDDVAERNSPYAGSYYVDASVDIEGSTVFTPYPNTYEVLLPSLRRNSAGTGIELGATEYGQFTAWSKTGWGAASGTIIPAQRLRVTAYVQAKSKAFAVKVTAGNRVYRSAWVTDFHWATTNLGIMRYVGENNSGVYFGGTEYIYVSALTGCQDLSDATVEARFRD